MNYYQNFWQQNKDNSLDLENILKKFINSMPKLEESTHTQVCKPFNKNLQKWQSSLSMARI